MLGPSRLLRLLLLVIAASLIVAKKEKDKEPTPITTTPDSEYAIPPAVNGWAAAMVSDLPFRYMHTCVHLSLNLLHLYVSVHCL